MKNDSKGKRMRIVCVGGGPASLYFSILMKAYDKDHDITVLERNPAGSTYGWGVTYWGDLLDKFHDNDHPTALAISENSFAWSDGAAYIRGEKTVHRGDQGFGIGRQCLLDVLADRATELGVRVQFEHEIESPSQLPDADLIIAGDGVNSRLRQFHADHFKTKVVEGQDKYIWLGTSKVFNSFTFSFVETDFGWIWFYAYGFSNDLSTCIVECAPETWTGLGFDTLGEGESIALLEKLFAEQLDGHPLINKVNGNGNAPWLNFRTVTNEKWHHDNIVLMGDAAHTTHYSIGAGTKLALEDAIGLAGALRQHKNIQPALDAYEKERKFDLLSSQSAARYSAQWYENIPRYIGLKPRQFFTLLGQRHSPLLPHVPPRMYYRIHQASDEITMLRNFRKWLGPKLARTLHGRRSAKGKV
jgi:2-polyprenyl-6-methoxyphenol hydroxylase-like FAD-dependent oxidoreductase